MIGNDVIDLIQSRHESNWLRKGYLEKIFTAEEQLLIKNNSQPELIVWVLWSMKEAAYKIYNRQTQIRAYIPKKLVCALKQQDDLFIFGTVICDQNLYYTKTSISEDLVHTIAVTHENELDNVIEIERKEIIKDHNGIPFLSSLNMLLPVSISHHGRFEKVVCIAS